MTTTHARRTLAALSAALFVSSASAQQFAAPREVLRQFRGERGEAPAFGGGRDHRGGPRFDFSNGWRGEQVRTLAHDLQDRSRAMRERYREEKPGNFFKQLIWAAAYNSLQNLEGSAARFHRSVESRWQDPEDTWEDYQALVAAFNDAAQTVPNAYHADRIEGNWRETVAAMHWLDQAYRHRRPPQGGGHGRQTGAAGWAYEAEQAARQAYDAAVRTPSRGDMWERDAIKELAELAQKAASVREMIERRSAPRDVSWEVRRLESQVDDAERAVKWADSLRHVQDELRRVSGAVAGLKAAVEQAERGGQWADDGRRDDDWRRYPRR
ncbi:hypothetical protein EPO15_05060 [bacterium]|nr:MAG: hypothetical protein EPO15_05060 [bacterium]